MVRPAGNGDNGFAMDRTNYCAGWVGSLLLVTACVGCQPRGLPSSDSMPDSARLTSLGPKVGLPGASPAAVGGPVAQSIQAPAGYAAVPAQPPKVASNSPSSPGVVPPAPAAPKANITVAMKDPTRPAYLPPPEVLDALPEHPPVASPLPSKPAVEVPLPPPPPELPDIKKPTSVAALEPKAAKPVALPTVVEEHPPVPPPLPPAPPESKNGTPPSPPLVLPPDPPGIDAPRAGISITHDSVPQSGISHTHDSDAVPQSVPSKQEFKLPLEPPGLGDSPPTGVSQPAARIGDATAMAEGPSQPPAPLAPLGKGQTAEPPPLVPAKPLPGANLQPVSKGVPGKPAADLQTLYDLAAESYASIDWYIVRLKRRERVAGKDMPEELMLLKFQKQPFSMYFKWLAGSAKGREMVYVQGRYGNKLHVLAAPGDISLFTSGKRFAAPLDHPLVRSWSRHPITNLSIGSAIEQFGTLLDNMRVKDYRFGSLKYLGLVKRPEFEAKVEAVLQVIPPKTEPDMPQGGKRFWYFDTRLRFPVLMIAFDHQDHELEYYCFEPWLFPGHMSQDDFNPDLLWREK